MLLRTGTGMTTPAMSTTGRATRGAHLEPRGAAALHGDEIAVIAGCATSDGTGHHLVFLETQAVAMAAEARRR